MEQTSTQSPGESLAVMKTSKPLSEQGSEKRQLIRDYLVKFSLNCNEPLGDLAMQGYQQLWEESFVDLSYAVLSAALAKTVQRCRFFPKVADIRGEIDEAKTAATQGAAEIEWQRMLDLRRRYWSPDMPGGFSRGMPKLSERVQRATNASGVFKLQDCEPDTLHVWAKKRFIESYINFDKIEEFLLPDGEIKNLLAVAAQTKALPSINVPFQVLHERGLKHAEHLKKSGPAREGFSQVARLSNLWNSEEERTEAYRALQKEKETNPAVAAKVRSQKAALEAKGFDCSQPAR